MILACPARHRTTIHRRDTPTTLDRWVSLPATQRGIKIQKDARKLWTRFPLLTEEDKVRGPYDSDVECPKVGKWVKRRKKKGGNLGKNKKRKRWKMWEDGKEREHRM